MLIFWLFLLFFYFFSTIEFLDLNIYYCLISFLVFFILISTATLDEDPKILKDVFLCLY